MTKNCQKLVGVNLDCLADKFKIVFTKEL